MRRFLCSFNEQTVDAYDFDVIIVGTGVAGLYSALHIDPSLQVALVTKANIDESNSFLAQGGIAAVMTPDDNYVNHIDDTLKAGAGLCNVDAVRVLVEEGPENIRTLIDMQVPFDVNADGDLQITREGGHRMRRIVHCGGDATGKETTMQLGRIALGRENLHFFLNHTSSTYSRRATAYPAFSYTSVTITRYSGATTSLLPRAAWDRCMNTPPIRSERWATGLPLLPVQARR